MKKLFIIFGVILCLMFSSNVSASEFTDTEHWAKNYIQYVADEGYFYGASTTTFAPDRAITRGEFVTVLARYSNADYDYNLLIPFTDVKEDCYYTNAVLWASEKNIIYGYTDGTFRPNNSITREEAATILYNLYGGTANKNYNDYGSISDYATEAVKNCELFGGNNEGNFMPRSNLTRAEMAVILSRSDGKSFENYTIPSVEHVEYLSGKASAYSESLVGGLTASGERLSATAYTVAVPISEYSTYAGKRVEITYNGTTIIATCNDCGGFAKYGRVLDLSPGIFHAFGFNNSSSWGVRTVQYRWID